MRISVGSSGYDVAARHQVDRAFDRVAASSERLATMQRIRRAGDDPAQFMAAAELRGELTAIEKGLAARMESGTSENEAVQAALAGMAASLSGAYSQIADTDVASETSEFARSMILAETSVMALKFTNFARESAASLLDDLLQRLR